MYDAIVVGVGGMGSSTAFHLARSGCSVLGLERHGIPHEFGSSHGSTRIIRMAYSEGPEYVPLLRSAYESWRELEALSGRAILHRTGGLDIGPVGSWTVEGSLRSCREWGLEFEDLSAEEVNNRFPGCGIPDDMRAVHQRDAGYVLSEVAIDAYARAAQAEGAEILANVGVNGWSRRSKTLWVDTTAGAFQSRKLVITAGAWIGRLSAELGRVCRPERQIMLWTEPQDPEAFRPDRFPVFTMESPLGRYYGFPNHAGEGFKFGKFHHLRQGVEDPDKLDREFHPEDEAALREGIGAYFPLANGPTRMARACMFTLTPDEHFILDRLPGERDVFVAAGFSGHGFKFCSMVGRLMTEFCLDSAPSWDIGRFRLTRQRTAGW